MSGEHSSWGNYPGDIYPGANCPGVIFLGQLSVRWLSGGQLSWGSYLGGQFSWGAIVQEGIVRGQLSGGVIIREAIVLEPLNISQNSQENPFSRFFLNKVAALWPATLLKRRLWHRCFPINFCEVFKNTYKTPLDDCFWPKKALGISWFFFSQPRRSNFWYTEVFNKEMATKFVLYGTSETREINQ